jgi:hypothetical protein
VPARDLRIGVLPGRELEVQLEVGDLGVEALADRSYSGQKSSWRSEGGSSSLVEKIISSASASLSLWTE